MLWKQNRNHGDTTAINMMEIIEQNVGTLFTISGGVVEGRWDTFGER